MHPLVRADRSGRCCRRLLWHPWRRRYGRWCRWVCRWRCLRWWLTRVVWLIHPWPRHVCGMLRGHGEIRRVSELSIEESIRDVVVETPLTAVFVGEVVEVTAHVVGQREQSTVRELNELATDEAETSVRACTVEVRHAYDHRLCARSHAVVTIECAATAPQVARQ